MNRMSIRGACPSICRRVAGSSDQPLIDVDADEPPPPVEAQRLSEGERRRCATNADFHYRLRHQQAGQHVQQLRFLGEDRAGSGRLARIELDKAGNRAMIAADDLEGGCLDAALERMGARGLDSICHEPNYSGEWKPRQSRRTMV